jgi:hypothetical protein
MTKIVLELESCKKCPHHYASEYPTSDSFERPEYYWCKNPDIKREKKAHGQEDERRRIFIKQDRNFKKLSYVAGYVEWRDKIPIPDWCPLRVKE